MGKDFDWRKRLLRLFPCVKWLKSYKLSHLRYDIVAGFTVGLTLVPQCMAYAQIANVKPEHGLYSSFLAQFIYALIGTSKDASIGASSIVSMILAGMNAANPLIKEGDNTYCALMSFFGGIILIAVGIFRLGFIVNLFSIPVVNGFTSAAGFAIIASQLKPLLGLSEAPNQSPCVFIKQIANVFMRSDEIKSFDVAFGMSTIAFLLLMQYLPVFVEKMLVRSSKVGELTSGQAKLMQYLRFVTATRNVFVFVFTTVAAYLLVISDREFYEKKITLVGYINPGLPIPSFPSLDIYGPPPITTVSGLSNKTADNTSVVSEEGSDLLEQEETVLLKSALNVLSDMSIYFVLAPMMMMLELFAITKALGRKNGYRVDPSNELFAIGLGNILQSFFQSMPATAAVTRAALNDQCGVKTQLASVISGTIVLVATFSLTQTFYYIPKAALAGIIITAAHSLIDFHTVRSMYREYWRDVVILFLTFCLCLFFDIVNMLTFLRPVVRMKFSITREIHALGNGDVNKITVVKLSHGMKYPSADKFLDRMARIMSRGEKHIVLDCQFVTGIDYTGLQAVRGILLLAYQRNQHIIFANLEESIVEEIEAIGLDHWKYVESVDDGLYQYNEAREDRRNSSDNVEPRSSSEQHLKKSTSIDRVVSITRPTSHGSHLHHHDHHNYSTSSVGRLVSITRPHHRHHRSALKSDSGSSVVSRQNSKDSRHHDANVEDGFHDDEVLDRKTQESILRNLSIQAYLYEHIPIGIGNYIEADGNNDADDDDDDDDVYDDIEMTVRPASQPIMGTAVHHGRVSNRISRISENREDASSEEESSARQTPQLLRLPATISKSSDAISGLDRSDSGGISINFK